jgi:dihydroorotase
LKNVFGIPSEEIIEGANANLTLFDPSLEWTFSENDILSTSKNAALLNARLKGKAYGIYANNQLVIQQ